MAEAEGSAHYEIRPIRPEDDAAVAQIIRSVMPEFGASGPGFAINDPEVGAMSAAYASPRAAYFVITGNGEVMGGGGVAPLAGGDEGTCELRKMYFRPELRGRGLGQRLLTQCLDTARALGFRRCYLETLGGMTQARALYLRNGFQPIPKPLGNTGHFGCDAWFVKKL